MFYGKEVNTSLFLWEEKEGGREVMRKRGAEERGSGVRRRGEGGRWWRGEGGKGKEPHKVYTYLHTSGHTS